MQRFVKRYGILKQTPEGWVFIATTNCPIQRLEHKSRIEIVETVYYAIKDYGAA